MSNFHGAVPVLTSAIARNPKAADHYAFRAWAFANMDRLELASADVKKALALDASNSNAYLARCQIHQRKGDDAAIIADATKCLGLDPAEAQAFAIRGCAYAHLRDWGRAESDFVNAVRLNEGDLISARNLEVARRMLAPPEQKEGELPIDGTWIAKFYSGDTPLPEQPAEVKDAELHFGGQKIYWKDIKLLKNGRYSALRIEPGVLSNWEHKVEFFIDQEGTLRQDDTNLPVLYRSLGRVTFVQKKLDHPEAFKQHHMK